MISVVTWKWSQTGYRSTFDAAAVNALRQQVARHYHGAHRFICVTDDAAGLDSSIEVLPAWNDFREVPSPHGTANPSCYRRLRMFAPDIGRFFGERFVSLDLDTVIVGDVTPLWDRPEPFVAWRDPTYLGQYNGSMVLLRAGAFPFVWTGFNPQASPAIARAHGFRGSDQAWISCCLPGHPTWIQADGVYSYRMHIAKRGIGLPANARIVFFHGAVKPWHAEALDVPWIGKAYHGPSTKRQELTSDSQPLHLID